MSPGAWLPWLATFVVSPLLPEATMAFSGVAKLGKAMFAAVSNMVNPECLNSKKALQSDVLFRF